MMMGILGQKPGVRRRADELVYRGHVRWSVWHRLCLGLTLVWLGAGVGWAQQSGGNAPVASLPGGLPFPRQGQRIPVPPQLLGQFGITYVQNQEPEAYIIDRQGQLVLQWQNRDSSGNLGELQERILSGPTGPSISVRIYPPHRQIEFPGETRFHQGSWRSVGQWGQFDVDSDPNRPGRYWLPEDGLFPSGQRTVYDPKEGKINYLYDRETAPCATYIRFREEGIERAVNQYVNSVQLLAGRSISAHGQIPTASDVQQGVVVPRGLMEELAAARCRCRTYLDLFTQQVTGMRRTTPLSGGALVERILGEGLSPEMLERLPGRAGGAWPLTDSVLDLLYEAMDRQLQNLPRTPSGQVMLLGMENTREGQLLNAFGTIMSQWSREFEAESARLHACNMLGPEALEKEEFYRGEPAFGDCELAQVATVQMQMYVAHNPQGVAANALRQIFPNDFKNLLRDIPDGENTLLRIGGGYMSPVTSNPHPISFQQYLVERHQPPNTLGIGLQLDRLTEVASKLNGLCEQTRAMQATPAAEQQRACRQLTKAQQEMQQMQAHSQMAARRQTMVGQLGLPAAMGTEQQLRMEMQRLMIEEQQREKQAEIDRLGTACGNGAPRIAYAAGVAALETGPCRDLDEATQALDAATRRQTELQQSLNSFFSGAAQRSGNLTQAAQEGFQIQRQVQQATNEMSRLQQQVQKLESLCQSRVRQVASSPAVLSTLRHANPYQPALPNACEDAIEGLRELQKELSRGYGVNINITMLQQQNNPALAEINQQITRLFENASAACQGSPDPLQRKFACETRVALHLRTQATVNNVLSWAETRLRQWLSRQGAYQMFADLSDEELQRRALEAPIDPVITRELRFLQERGLLPAGTVRPNGTVRLSDVRDRLTRVSLSEEMRNVERCD